jgi:glutamate-1-semialdehyde 2,1-aminomutase
MAVDTIAGMTTTRARTAVDPARVAALTEREKARLVERTRRSGEYFDRARRVMPGGVPSQFQRNDPWPVFVERGEGARVWDVDGNEYVDFHNGFGVMCVGHANPVIAAAVKARMDDGTHFAAPTDGAIIVAEELRRRWGLPQWRFTNSGTESTMDAVHLARGATGRDIIVKIEGSYHGHHDAVMVSVKPPADLMGHRERPSAIPYGLGYPSTTASQTRPVPFNDAGILERVLDELEGEVAGVILEPAMMNINIVPPVPGYLERVRELATERGIVLIFDEVKTGAAVAAGGATELFGVTPDVVCLAKAICGGLPGGAVGMTEPLAELVADGRVRQQGTFNGNPLVMAAAAAALLGVLTPAAYTRLHEANAELMAGCERVIADYGLPAHTVGMGSKGCVVMATEPIREYRDYLTRIDHPLTELAWLYHMNSGVFMTPGVDEEWTLSVLHSDDDLRRYVEVFENFARDVTADSPPSAGTA